MATPGKCFLVTGPPGIGKTTLVMKVLESLKISNPTLNVQGFYTREIREGNNERVGFEVVTLDGRRGPLASTTISSAESLRWPTVGKYKVDIASFESLAQPELQIKEDTDLFIIDEVGKMELYSSSFFPAVLKVLESNIPLLASIPIPKFGRDIPGGRVWAGDLGGSRKDEIVKSHPDILECRLDRKGWEQSCPSYDRRRDMEGFRNPVLEMPPKLLSLEPIPPDFLSPSYGLSDGKTPSIS